MRAAAARALAAQACWAGLSSASPSLMSLPAHRAPAASAARRQSAGLRIGQRFHLAVSRQHQPSLADLGDDPAVVEHGAGLMAGTVRRYDVGTDTEPECLQLRRRQHTAFIHRHVRRQRWTAAIALVEPALDRLPGFMLAPRKLAAHEETAIADAYVQVAQSRGVDAGRELAHREVE